MMSQESWLEVMISTCVRGSPPACTLRCYGPTMQASQAVR